MANAFNLTAQINIRGPSNVNKVVSGIQKQLNGLNANVNLGINRSTTKTLAAANKQLQAINANLNKVAGSATRANTSMAQFAKSANSLGGTGNVASKINSASKATQQLGRNAKISFKDIKLARTEIEEFGRQSALAIRRFTAFASVTSVIYGVNNAINRALGDFVKFDRQLVRISQVSGTAVSSLKGLQGTIGDLATSIGVSSSSLAEISVTLTQAGFSVREVQKALRALALTDVAPTFNNLNQTVEGSIALLRQFSIGAGQLEASLGSINAVAAKFAVESSDIIAAIQRAGGVFAAASRGVSEGTNALNEFIAVFTAVRSTTREGAETIATGLRTIFTRLQRESTIDALKEFGVSLQDAQGKFVGAYKAVQLLSEGLGGLDPRDIRFSKIVEELGGFRQIGKVIPLIGQFATAQKALSVANQGQGSLAESNAKAQAALAIQFARVREEFLRLVRDVAGTDSFKGLVTQALNLASALIKVADSVKGIVPILGLLAAARGASAITQFGRGFGGGLRRTQGFASGGTVPGSGNTDSVPAMLTPGEFVLRKSSVRAIGTEKLHKMNKFSGGSLVKQTQFTRTGKFLSNTYGSLRKKVDPKAKYSADINPIPVPTATILPSMKARASKKPGMYHWENFEKAVASKYGLQAAGGRSFLDYPGSLGEAKFLKKGATYANDKETGFLKGNNNQTMLAKYVGHMLNKGQYAPGEVDVYYPENINEIRKNLPKPKREATGGSIQDTVPAMLTPGEFVMNKKSAKAVGYGNLRKMNTRPQGFNKGGVVGFNTGGLAAMKGRGGTIDISSFNSQLAGLENAFASMGAPVDQLTNAVMKNGKVSYNSYRALIRQSKANIDLARSSAKTSDDLKKVAAMEKQLMAIRKKGAAQARGGGGGGDALAKMFDPQSMFYFTAALGSASVGLESFDTAVTTGVSTTINSLLAMGLTVSTAVQTFSALRIALEGSRVAAIAASLGLTGVGAVLGPITITMGVLAAAVAGTIAIFQGLDAAAKKRLEQERKQAQSGLDTAATRTTKALEKLSKEASAVNFQEAIGAAASQAGASDALARTALTGVSQDRQNVSLENPSSFKRWARDAAANLTFGYVDSLQDATDNNKNRAQEAAKKLADIYGKQAAAQMSLATARFNAGFTLGDLSGAAAKRRRGGTLTEAETTNADIFDSLVEARLKSDEIYIQSQIKAAETGRQLTAVEIDTHRKRVRDIVELGNSEANLASKVAENARAQEAAKQIAYQLSKNFVALNNKIQASANIIDAESQARQTSIESLAAIAEGSLKIAEVADRASIALNNLAGATPQERQQALTATRNNLTSVLGRDRANEITALSGIDVDSLQSGVEDVISRTPVNKLSGAIQARLSSDVDAQLGPGASASTRKQFKELSEATATRIENRIQPLNVDDPDYNRKRQAIIDEETDTFNEALEKTTDAARETATTINNQLNKALNNFASNLNQAAALEAKAQELRYAGIKQQESNNNRISQIMTRESSVTPSSIAARGRNEAMALAGTTDPNSIKNNILAGTDRIGRLRETLDESTDQGERKLLIEAIDNETRSINNNRKALDVLSETTQEVIDSLLEEAETRNALQDANKQFADTLLTSGPAELKALDESLVRANQRLNGFIPQAGASERKKFFELLKSTGSVRQAQQGVAADMRKTDLQTLDQTRASRELLLSNQIFQQLTAQGVDKQTASVQAGQQARQRIRQDDANIYGQMGREAGLGRLGQQIVGAATATMFDPRNDPIMGALADSLNNQVGQQAELNTTLVNLNQTLANMTREMAGEAYDRSVDSINPARRSRGGLMYAANGQYIDFKPKGTDTVPAMLTPGEFVVNRQATQKNMGLLQSINGGRVNTYSGGGKVKYLAGGGFAQRDTNKDGVITIGAEDASGLRDPNGDGRITFAEFMVGTARSPEQQALVNSLSNSVMGRRGGSNTTNFLRAAGTEDMINTFGPMMDDLQAYQAMNGQFAKDLKRFRIINNMSGEKGIGVMQKFRESLGTRGLAFEFFKDSPGTFNKKITIPSLVKGSMGIYDNTLQKILSNNPDLTADEAREETLDAMYGKGGALQPYGDTRAGFERQLERRSLNRTFQGTSLDARKAKRAGDEAVGMARRNRINRMLRGEEADFDYEQVRHDAEIASLKKTLAAKKRNKLRSFESGRGPGMTLVEQERLGITEAEYNAAQANRQAQIDKELLDPTTERGKSEDGFTARSEKREADRKAKGDAFVAKRMKEFKDGMNAIKEQSKIESQKELEEQRIADLERKYGPETVARIKEEQQQYSSGQIKASILAEEKAATAATRARDKKLQDEEFEKLVVERQKQYKIKAEAEAKKLAQQENRKNIISEIDAQIESVQRERSGLDSAGYDPRYMTGKDEFGNKTPQWFEKNLGDTLEGGASSGVGSGLWEYLDYIPGFNMGKSVTPVKDNQRKEEAKNTLKNLRAAKAAALHLSDPERYPAPFGLNSEEASNYLESKTGFNWQQGQKVGKNRAQQETQAGNYANSQQEFLDRQRVIDIGYEGGMIVPRALAAAVTGPSLWLSLLQGLGDAGLGYAASGKDKEGALQDASFQGGLELLMAAAGPALGPSLKKALAQVPIETLSKNVDFSAMFTSVPGIRQMVERAKDVASERAAGNLARNKALFNSLQEGLGRKPTADEVMAFSEAFNAQKNVEQAVQYAKDFAGTPGTDVFKIDIGNPLNPRPGTLLGGANRDDVLKESVLDIARGRGGPTANQQARQKLLGQKADDVVQENLDRMFPDEGLRFDPEVYDLYQISPLQKKKMPTSFKQAPPPVGAPIEIPGVKTIDDLPDPRMPTSFKQAPAPPEKPAIFIPDDYRPTVDDFGGSLLDRMKDPDNIMFKRRGGMVYASNGMLVPYRPQGTDTVPAMLTPGEFVVNRNATSQYLPVLRAINSGYNTHGQMVNHLARGGVAGSPQYLKGGSMDPIVGTGTNNGVSVNSQIVGLEELKAAANMINEALSGGTENMNQVAAQLNSGARSLSETAATVPNKIISEQRVDLNHNGIPQNIGAEFGKSAEYAIGQADSRSAQQLNDFNTANEGAFGLPSPNNNSTIS